MDKNALKQDLAKIGRAWLDAPHVAYQSSYLTMARYLDNWFNGEVKDGIPMGGIPIHWDLSLTQGDPYASSLDMFADMRKGRLKILAGGSPFSLRHVLSSPLWSMGYPWEMNHAYRAHHDIIGHWGAADAPHYPFETIDGELDAYAREIRKYPRTARPAAFSESIGQLGVYALTGDFVKEQKAVVLPEFAEYWEEVD